MPFLRISLVVQGLRLWASTIWSSCSIPGWETKITHAKWWGQNYRKQIVLFYPYFLAEFLLNWRRSIKKLNKEKEENSKSLSGMGHLMITEARQTRIRNFTNLIQGKVDLRHIKLATRSFLFLCVSFLATRLVESNPQLLLWKVKS